MIKSGKSCILSCLLVVLLSWAFISCGGDGGGGTTATIDPDRYITVIGSLHGGLHSSKTIFNKLLNEVFPPAYALDPIDIANVLVIYPSGFYEMFAIQYQTFELEIKTGSSVGIIFLDKNDNYLGYLSLGNGIDSLPLNWVPGDVETINLGNLSSNGFIVEPSISPLGSTISMTSEDRTVAASQDDNLASIVKNPDMDGNGVIDVLENKFYMIVTFATINAGSFYDELTPTISIPTDARGSRLWFIAKNDLPFPDKAYFTGPLGSGMDNSIQAYNPSIRDGEAIYYSPEIEDAVPPAGEYFISYRDRLFNFTIDTPLYNAIIYVLPTITLNENGSINKISWKHVLSDGENIIDSLIPNSFELTLVGGGGEIYKFKASKYETQHTLSDQGIVGINGMRIEYQDPCNNIIFLEYGGDKNSAKSSIEGHVTLSGNTDHSDVNVSLSTEEGVLHSVTTDQTGYYYLSGFEYGNYIISAEKNGFRTETNFIHCDILTSHLFVDFTLVDFNSIEGHVTLPGETNHSGVTVTLTGGIQISTITDEAGYFYMSDYPDGSYTLTSTKNNYAEYIYDNLVFQITNIIDFNIWMDTVNCIGGHVYLEGETNHKNINIGISSDSGGAPPGISTMTNEEGGFYYHNFSDGTYTIYAWKDGYITQMLENVVFDNTCHANISMTLEKE